METKTQSLECPKCGSGDIQYNGIGYANNEQTAHLLECRECGKHWEESFVTKTGKRVRRQYNTNEE